MGSSASLNNASQTICPFVQKSQASSRWRPQLVPLSWQRPQWRTRLHWIPVACAPPGMGSPAGQRSSLAGATQAASVGQLCTVGSSCRLLAGRNLPPSPTAVSMQVRSDV